MMFCRAPIGCRLKVGVADAMSDVCIPITVMVPVYMTISELKEKVNDLASVSLFVMLSFTCVPMTKMFTDQ